MNSNMFFKLVLNKFLHLILIWFLETLYINPQTVMLRDGLEGTFQVSHGVLVSFMHKDCLDELKLSNFLEAIYLCVYSCAYLCIKHVLITYYTPGVKDL